LPGRATTGFTSEQFDELVERVGQRMVWDSGTADPGNSRFAKQYGKNVT
jgi:hypothetical protein